MNIALIKYVPSFIHAANNHSFSAAARIMGVTPAAVSKNVKQLEAALSLRLFHRTTHTLSLTDDGERFYHKILPVVQSLEEALVETENEKKRVSGRLRVSAPYSFGKIKIVPLLKLFNEQYPDVELDLRFEDRFVDLVEEGIDVAIGSKINDDSRIIARKITTFDFACVASPKFIATYGIPKTPQQLLDFKCIRYRSPTTYRLIPWKFQGKDNVTFTIEPPETVMSVNATALLCDLALNDIGICVVGGWQAAPYIQTGELIPLLTSYLPSEQPVMIYYSSREYLPAKIRVFIDFMIDRLK